jgi:hypothetical protein
MRNPLDSYGPQEDNDAPMGPGRGGPDPFRWLQWLQLALTTALLVLFVSQVMSFRDVNRKIARLHERIDLLDNNRLLETRPAIERNSTEIEQRLQKLENAVRDLAAENIASPSGDKEIPAFQLPPPPRLLP